MNHVRYKEIKHICSWTVCQELVEDVHNKASDLMFQMKIVCFVVLKLVLSESVKCSAAADVIPL